VVDGKQRISTLLNFVRDEFPVGDDFPNETLRGRFFRQFDDSMKLSIWRYSFAVEFIEQENESIINDIFNRMNKNVARLSPQELRHARFAGRFLQKTEALAEFIEGTLPSGFPRIQPQSKRQMKDVENVANLLLFCELGERSLSQLDLDNAYSRRDEDWESEQDTTETLTRCIDYINEMFRSPEGSGIVNSRLRNQADFYSLFAGIVELQRAQELPSANQAAIRLVAWVQALKLAEESGSGADDDLAYLTAARSASNDPTPRRKRIERVKQILRG
jgi:hypothetical protein